MRLATAAQMREIDRRAVEEFHIPSIVLMENAAVRIADEIWRRYAPRVVTVAAGPGNNGGDGIAVARHLAIRYGADVQVFLCGDPSSKTTPDYDTNLKIARASGIMVRGAASDGFEGRLSVSDIVVDALLGTGAKGNPRPAIAKAINAMNSIAAGRIVAVDLPSGIDADTGSAGAASVRAGLVITLGLSKIGLHLAPAATLSRNLIVADLCFPPQLTGPENADLRAFRYDEADVRGLLPDRIEQRDTNKSTYGAVALLAGSNGFAGAAALCCLGAAKAGAGLVSLGVPEGLIDVMMARLPDVVMSRGLLDTGGRQFRHAALDGALSLVEKMDAVGFGPGIGHADGEVQRFAKDFIAKCPKPMVLDADALTILALEKDHGASLVRKRAAATILTPHPGEMGRLLGKTSTDIQGDRLDAVRRAADQFGCVALLKGDRTLIAAPDGRLAINETGNPGMASGGMGDVLTGVATTLAAQIADPFEAAAAAAFLHGLAGDLAADESGRAGLTADILAARLPEAIRRCRSQDTIAHG